MLYKRISIHKIIGRAKRYAIVKVELYLLCFIFDKSVDTTLYIECILEILI